MASRALGAFFALAAAAAFVVSIATSAWWTGTPIVDGKPIAAKLVHAGPLGVTGCNVGGDGSCEAIATSSTVQLVGYAALGATAVATLFLLILLVAALRVSDNRRGFATASLLVTLLAAGAGGALLALGPGIEASQHVEVPYGYGIFVFGGGVLASMLASAVTRRVEPEPLRLKPSLQRVSQPAFGPAPAPQPHPVFAPQPQPPQAFAPQPQPPQAFASQPVPAPTAPTAPPGPHRPSNPEMNVVGSAQLRPLYDVEGSGVVPTPQPPALPMRPPTPMSRDAIDELIANAPLGPSPSGSSSPVPTRPKPPSVPPPRASRPSAPPPHAHRPSAPQPRVYGPSDPPPRDPPPRDPAPAAKRPTGAPRPRHLTPPGEAMRVKAPAPPRNVVPPPDPRGRVEPHPRPETELATPPPAEPKSVRGSKPRIVPPPPRSPTLAHSVPPMPITDGQPVLGRATTEDDDRLEAALRETEYMPAVDADGNASPAVPAANAKAVPRRADTDMRTGKNVVVEPTDIGPPPTPPAAADEGADKPAPPAERTAETPVVPEPGVPAPPSGDSPNKASSTTPGERTSQTLLAPEPARAAQPPGEHTAKTLMAPEPKRRDPEDLMRTIEQNPKVPLAGAARTSQTPIPTVDAERAAQLPISTAPTSLPPPKQIESMSSGPSPACPQCESPMSWVEEHLRFYCRSCRMYF